MKKFLSCLLLLSAAVFPWVAQATTASLLSVYTTDNVPALTLGYCDQFSNCNGGQLTFNGSTSGATILKPNAVAGSGTLTMPTATGTLMATGNANTFDQTATFNSGVTFNSPITGAAGGSGTWAGTQTFTSSPVFSSGISSIDTHYEVAGQTLTGNPMTQTTVFNITTASANAGIPILTSVSGRTIYPTNLVILASGTASGATSVIVNCGLAGVGGNVATFPIANLVNQLPVTPFFVSTSAITRGPALAEGCGSGNALMLSVNGTLATTTNLFGVVSYIVQ